MLLDVAPDQYVTERDRMVKQARAAKDRGSATFYQSLKRPTVPLWAVLAAGDDPKAVDSVMKVTTELGDIQGGSTKAADLAAATQRRRKALETFVDRAVKALAKWDTGAEKRRPEIRSIVDQLSRHPDLAESWVDATLRELPDSDFGFGAIADMSDAEIFKPKPKAKRSPKSAGPPSQPAPDRGTDRAARAAQAEQTRQARKDVAGAVRQLATAERRLDAARAAMEDATEELAGAEDQHAAAEQRHKKATAELAALQDA
ncbi:MAG: hypothetical protein JJD93_18425 [Ilumatobacteraceae bacterium]|nr:hypothetical protein [Ilumatobacteraceae bacterium]